jgi:hypothetical protein
MSGFRHGLGRMQRHDIDHTGNKSMESERQDKRPAKGLCETDGFSPTPPGPLHPSLCHDASHCRSPVPATVEPSRTHTSEYDGGARPMPLSRLSLGITLKMAILRTSAEGHERDRLFNPTEWWLRDESRLFRTARSGRRNQTRKSTYAEDDALHRFYLFVSR